MSRRSVTDLIGVKHGFITAIGDGGVVNNRAAVLVQCECGNQVTRDASHFRRGLLKSCTKCRLVDRVTAMAGKRFGAITVIRQLPSKTGKTGVAAMWECRCDCGVTFSRSGGNIRLSGDRASCGCKRGVRRRTHGKAGTRVHSIWMGMHRRCNVPTNPSFPQWGGRGIKVCRRWKSFASFYKDMGDPPTDKHTIDRIDNDGNYTPKNCRWATRAQQSTNKRNTIFLTFRGKTKCLSEWAKEVGLSRGAIRARLRKGWSVRKALGTPRLR